jgi:hypothetical protein
LSIGANKASHPEVYQIPTTVDQRDIVYMTTHEAIDPKLYQEDMTLKEVEMDPISFKAISDLDTLWQ